MFFAYRDFTGEADSILAERNMGRAHHRAIYFIGVTQYYREQSVDYPMHHQTKPFPRFIRANERWLCHPKTER